MALHDDERRTSWPPVPDRVPGLLSEAADKLSQARSADALRAAVEFNLDVWRGIARGLAGDRFAVLPDEQRRLLHDHAAYVTAGSAGATCPDDAHIETFITLARRDSEWLGAMVERAGVSAA